MPPRLSAIVAILSLNLYGNATNLLPALATEWGRKPVNLIGAQLSTSQSMTPEAAIARLFTQATLENDWFAPEFLRQVPLAQVQLIIDSMQTELGKFQEVVPNGQNFLVVMEKGTVPTQITLNQSGQIIGLLFQPPRLKIKSLAEAVSQLQQLPGQVSLLVLEGDTATELAALNPDLPLAVGSTFKLAVLQALRTQIETGQQSWRSVVELRPEWKSLPSGVLQTWADGSWLTIQSLAALMISQSDNTATDALMRIVGRDSVEAVAPERNRPFLTTREAFLLKSPSHKALYQRYRLGNLAQRRSLLTELTALPLPDVSEFTTEPRAIDVEWFFTTRELCQLMQQVRDLPVMRINPGVASSTDWQRVAFKGGSEPGVLNLTTWVEAKTGQQYCISATWNHTANLDDYQFQGLYSTILDLVKAKAK
ncbi:serine hydrolase [Pantanalinema sp. GBBB05]|uniref:serine hydrolase n=1 Tax=Pantanalinema sp. GBBB05 TaxID=2604139 RepID=UPI001D1EF389|nr:serine hydrolase [Pantanalinema sp. GBBB05]